MEREKMIEEMAMLLCKDMCFYKICARAEHCVRKNCIVREKASLLYNFIAKKYNDFIPEGSVVLTEEEYDNLVKFNVIKQNIVERQLGFNDGFGMGLLQILTNLYELLELIKDKDYAKVLLNHIEKWEESYGVKVKRNAKE